MENSPFNRKEQKAAILRRLSLPRPEDTTQAMVIDDLVEEYAWTSDAIKGVLKRSREPKEKGHGNRALTIDQETRLLEICEFLSHNDNDITMKQGASLLKNWLKKDSMDGCRKLFERFQKRHEVRLKATKPKSISSARKDAGMVDAMKAYIEAVGPEMEARRYMQKQMVTFDEIIMSVPSARSQLKRVTSRSKTKANIKRDKSGSAPSVCLFVAADGKTLLACIVFPVKVLERGNVAENFPLEEYPRDRSSLTKIIYGFTQSGRMNTALYFEVIQKFMSHWKMLHGNLEVRLQGDRLGAHTDFKVLSWLSTQQARCIFPPPRSTSISAPCDDKIFAVLKNALVFEMEENLNFKLEFKGRLTTEIASILPKLIKERITPAVIKASFKATGAYPWNPKLMLKRAAELAPVEPESCVSDPALLQALRD